ncbi:MAG: phenylalanine--tRNA ligase subunit alpha [Persephonella sp.]|nr:MAG: phenylalanine--tRNA ligase subunit alpha [Persephonella sp.]RUM60716.1 MAG: phenylalanine--tRNA ligase subunit alpha [Persephonella sp.]
MGLKEDLIKLKEEAKKLIGSVKDKKSLDEIRVKYLGKKGEIKKVLKSLSKLSPDERREIGKIANDIKDEIEKLLKDKLAILKEKELEEELKKSKVDIHLPADWVELGHQHILTKTLQEIVDIFIAMGFSVEEGPEVEREEYNFDMLNIPKDHPARDMQDTFFINKEGYVLRTHTSPVQIRTMLKNKPPVAIVAPGRVYRKDMDPTHTPMFHQIEGLLVDENITYRDLKGTLQKFLQEVFGKNIKIRLRPSYFPFTEPSFEVDISCTICSGLGCRVCKGTGWLEVLGSGMVDPNVFEAVGIDPEKYTGFAFGLGIERIAMLKYRVPDIRLFYYGDLRFIKQF